MDNIGKAVIVFSLLGVGILYGLSLTSFVEPPYVPLEEVACRAGTNEGELIRTKGVITDFRATDYGNMLTLKGNKTELLIFVDTLDKSVEKLNLSYGDVIEVEGRVNTYKGRPELVVHGGHGNAIKKLSAENENENENENIAFVSQIAMHPEDYKGERVSVVGYADNVYKHVFYLADEQGKYLLRVRVEAETDARAKSDDGSIPISALQKGDKIIAEGIFRYDPGNMRYELNLISLRWCS